MNYQNFLNYMLVEASNNITESLNLNRECTPSIIASLTIHIGSVFLAQDWRVLSASVLCTHQGEETSQRLIISPKNQLDSYIIIDICLFTEVSHWQAIITNTDAEKSEPMLSSSLHTIVGIAQGDKLISQEMPCEDTVILGASRRILWHIKE